MKLYPKQRASRTKDHRGRRNRLYGNLVCWSDRGLGWSGRGTQKVRFDPDCGDFEVLC